MAEPTAGFAAALAARQARAREAMAVFLRGLAGAPLDPLAVFHPLGGFVLPSEPGAGGRRRLPELWAALAEAGIGRGGHSFGGEYLAADPCLYVAPPPWPERRRRLDARIRRVLAALPPRVARARLDFAGWLCLMVALETLRTDLCSVLWNELSIADAGAGSEGALARCEEALGRCVEATLALLPPLAGRRGRDERPEEIALGAAIPAAPALGTAPPGLGDDAVRAVRASDNTFLVWASLALLAREGVPGTGPCWAIGNGFGGIDLGWFAAAALTSLGGDAVAGTCRAGGHGAPRVVPDRARWPAGGSPRRVLFCDDSVSSGGTFAAFRSLCRRTLPGAVVEPFVLTYDLGARRDDADDERARWALARHATAAAPWSPSPHPKRPAPRDVDGLLAALRGSSDERMRWIAETQAAAVARLNEAPPRREERR